MKLYRALVLATLIGCGNGTAPQPSVPDPVAAEPTPAPTPAPQTGITVQMTAATLADKCGVTKPAAANTEASRGDSSASMSRARRACEESSIQLNVVAPPGATAASLHIVKVKLLDDSGNLVAELKASGPVQWSDSANGYVPWLENINPDTNYSVMYQLSRPSFDGIAKYQERDFVLEAEVSIGGANHQVSQTVKVSTMTALPPNVRT